MTIRPSLLGVLVILTLSCTPEKEPPDAAAVGEAPEAPSAEEVIPEPPFLPLHMTFTGDIMAHDVNYNRPPFSNIYEDVRNHLTADDLSFANLEFAVVPDWPVSNYPVFNVHPPFVDAAIKGGFDVFSLANNHSTDLGEYGVKKTRETLSEIAGRSPIYFSGLRETPDESFIPITIKQKGWTIGFMAVTLFLNTYGGSEYVQLVEFHDNEQKDNFLSVVRSIAPAFDLFIVSFHGGTEYATDPDPEKLEFFKEVLTSGVHIVWAHHPHVVQPWYLYNDGKDDKLILSSCGNFISGQTWNIIPEKPDPKRIRTGESALFQVTAVKTAASEITLSVSPILLTNYRDPEKGMVVRIFDDLLEDDMLSPEWRRFYTTRKPELARLVAPSPIQNLTR